MKQLLLLLFSSFSFSLFAQTLPIPVSTPDNDQLLQGPCYIFTVLAALESKAIESGHSNDFDLYEWNLYSKDVLGGITGHAQSMVTNSIAHARTVGVYEKNQGIVPTSIDELPNNDDIHAAGIAAFEAPCNPSFDHHFYSYNFDGLGSCTELDGEEPMSDLKTFDITAFDPSMNPYVYQTNGGLGFVHDDDPTEAEVNDHLNNGRGLIALFSNWVNDNDPLPHFHSVFIYGNEEGYQYKDSWPGDAGNKTSNIDFSHCTDIYYLTGTFPPPPTCLGEIDGPSEITGSSTYHLIGGNYTNITWRVSDGIRKDSPNGTTSITVSPNTCADNSLQTINVVYVDNGVPCFKSIDVTVNNAVYVPEDILVMSPNWNNGQTCPGITLPLEALDSQNDPSSTTYEWSIAGAIPQGNSTSLYQNVSTYNAIENIYLTFKVRAIRDACPPSAWRSISGISSPSNCGSSGSDGGKIVSSHNDRLTFANLDRPLEGRTELQYQIVSINGQILQKGSMPVFDPNIDISSLNDHLIFIHLYTEQGDFQQTFKHVINR